MINRTNRMNQSPVRNLNRKGKAYEKFSKNVPN